MLKIVKAADPIEVKQITTCIYAPPGTGKTSTGFTAEAPLLLDFDHGAYRSQFRKDTVQIAAWGDVESITTEDLAPYKTVIVDTAGRALDVLTADLIQKNPKLRGHGGALSLQGYGALKSAFVAWLKLLHSHGKDVVLLAHMDEQRNGDETIERLDVQGGSKGEIYKVADAMARIQIVNGARMLNFNPSDVAYGKNPAQLAVLPIPHFDKEPAFLAGVIAGIKAKLNEAGTAALAEQARMHEWREAFAELETAEQFDKKAAELSGAAPKVKGLLLAAAEKRGIGFDKKAKRFTPPQAKPAKAQAAQASA